MQCYLLGVTSVVIGFRDTAGYVHSIVRIPTAALISFFVCHQQLSLLSIYLSISITLHQPSFRSHLHILFSALIWIREQVPFAFNIAVTPHHSLSYLFSLFLSLSLPLSCAFSQNGTVKRFRFDETTKEIKEIPLQAETIAAHGGTVTITQEYIDHQITDEEKAPLYDQFTNPFIEQLKGTQIKEEEENAQPEAEG